MRNKEFNVQPSGEPGWFILVQIRKAAESKLEYRQTSIMVTISLYFFAQQWKASEYTHRVYRGRSFEEDYWPESLPRDCPSDSSLLNAEYTDLGWGWWGQHKKAYTSVVVDPVFLCITISSIWPFVSDTYYLTLDIDLGDRSVFNASNYVTVISWAINEGRYIDSNY